MNLLLLDAAEMAADGTARLSGRRARHVAQVLRATPGQRIAVGLVGGSMGTGEVVAASADELLLRVGLDRPPPPPSPVSLLLALPRPKILRKVLAAVASMGVKRLVLVGTWRVEKSYFASPLLAAEAMESELRLGLEQGRDTILPEVLVRRHFKPLVEDELDALFPSTLRLLAHAAAGASVEDRPVLAPTPAPLAALAVGPEGGFTEYETGALVRRGFAPVSLGPRPLRVDVAVPFAVAQVEMWLRRGHAPA